MQGREGKGSIYTWAAGNGGEVGDSCAADGYTSSIYTIAIGAAWSNGTPASYDEQCSAKMATNFMDSDTLKVVCMYMHTHTHIHPYAHKHIICKHINKQFISSTLRQLLMQTLNVQVHLMAQVLPLPLLQEHLLLSWRSSKCCYNHWLL